MRRFYEVKQRNIQGFDILVRQNTCTHVAMAAAIASSCLAGSEFEGTGVSVVNRTMFIALKVTAIFCC